MHRTKPEPLTAYLHRRMIDLYLDDHSREGVRREIERLARDRGVSDDAARALAADALDRWPVAAA